MAERPQLRALADRAGIVASFRGAGGETRVTSDATRVALLEAMGLDASSESSAAAALRDLDEHEARELLAPARVVVQGTRAADRIPLRLPEGSSARALWRLELRDEAGKVRRSEGQLGRGRALLPLPAQLGPGYYEVRVVLEGSEGPQDARQRLVIAPRRCVEVADLLGRTSAFGLMANLYTLRSRRNWGVGDLGDLEQLVGFAGEAGAAFVGISPLHFLWNRGTSVSPYAPVSRLYRNPLYLDMEAIPELAECEPARTQLADSDFRSRLEKVREAELLAYEGVAALEREILEPLHRTFAALHRDRSTPRGRAYASYRERQGDLLTDFATYLVLAERFSASAKRDWREWPHTYCDPRSPGVRRFREQHSEEVDFHCYIQFELDRQLQSCAHASEQARLRVGLLQDLALGSTAGGADAWMFQGLFAAGARMGAPPDEFNPAGQDWGMPPLDPRQLRDQAYGYWSQLLRASFAHAHALRIDHAMALTRLYWIPSGRPPSEGAYVRYPARDLLGILALESRRHGALVIGEDLGTVPPAFSAQLARWGILSWRVLYFERSGRGFRPSRTYSRRALVTANTHDLPPLAGFVQGRDLELRRQAGAIESDLALAEAQSERRKWCRALAQRLRAEAILGDGEALPPPPRLCAAVSAFLCRTPAPLVGIALDDLVGETEPVNLPGTKQDRFPSWRRRMALPVEGLGSQPGVQVVLGAVSRRAPRQT
jgi:4-alpha-glucanotransferase